MDGSVQQVRLPASCGLCDVIYRTAVPSVTMATVPTCDVDGVRGRLHVEDALAPLLRRPLTQAVDRVPKQQSNGKKSRGSWEM